jgi:hypothetical protein
MITRIFTLFTLVLLAGVSTWAQPLTIPERVRLIAPNPVFIERGCECVVQSFEEVVARADLVVHGVERQ